MATSSKSSEIHREEVLKLYFVDGLSVRAISRKLRMARRTVRRLVGKEPNPSRVDVRRGSMLMPFEPAMEEILRDIPDIRATTLLERLRAHGYSGAITIVREWLRKSRPRLHPPEAFTPLQFACGQAMQVDWADFGYAIPGCPRKVSCFVAVLCYSRYLYIEFTLSQKLPSLLRCMERALMFFGGVTEVDIFDNMKTVVRALVQGRPQFNPAFLAYGSSRGFATTACNPGRGNEKGRVERPIGFIRDRFWPGRRFPSLLDLNSQGSKWRDEFANTREHAVTGKIPKLVWQHEERASLRPLPQTPFDVDDVVTTRISKTYRVTFDRNAYTVPPRLVGQQVVVRGTDSAVRIFLGPNLVAEHARSWGIAEDVKDERHKEAALQYKPKALLQELPEGWRDLEDVGIQYLRLLRAGTRSIAADVRRIAWLIETHGASATMSAMSTVMSSGHVGADYVEHVMQHTQLAPKAPPLKLGKADIDGLSVPAPDLALYDAIAKRKTDGEPDDE